MISKTSEYTLEKYVLWLLSYAYKTTTIKHNYPNVLKAEVRSLSHTHTHTHTHTLIMMAGFYTAKAAQI